METQIVCFVLFFPLLFSDSFLILVAEKKKKKKDS